MSAMLLRVTPLPLLLLLSLAARAAVSPPVVPLWPDGAPGSEARRHEPEKVAGTNVSNIHHPSITAYLPPRELATGCAVVVAPGGGHARVVIQHEGYNVAEWLAARGIAAFVLKYRLGKDDATPAGGTPPYAFDVHGLADAQRAIRLVRARAADWGVNPAAVGIMGFSAGGELAFLAAMRAEAGRPDAPDPIDRQSARPDFQALIYPGKSHLIQPTPGAPPVFLAAGYGDRPDISEGLARVYLLFKQAKVPAELHLYAGAGHGFGVRATNQGPVATWTDRFHDWLADRKFLGPKPR